MSRLDSLVRVDDQPSPSLDLTCSKLRHKFKPYLLFIDPMPRRQFENFASVTTLPTTPEEDILSQEQTEIEVSRRMFLAYLGITLTGMTTVGISACLEPIEKPKPVSKMSDQEINSSLDIDSGYEYFSELPLPVKKQIRQLIYEFKTEAIDGKGNQFDSILERRNVLLKPYQVGARWRYISGKKAYIRFNIRFYKEKKTR